MDDELTKSLSKLYTNDEKFKVEKELPYGNNKKIVFIDILKFDRKIDKRILILEKNGKTVKNFTTEEEFINFFVNKRNWSFDFVASLIAILITCSIIFIVIYQAIYAEEISVPEILGSALTMILGFYFGMKIKGQE